MTVIVLRFVYDSNLEDFVNIGKQGAKINDDDLIRTVDSFARRDASFL